MINGKIVLGMIPARGGSKGIPRKNIRLVAGKPLIAYTIEEAKKSEYIDRLVIGTDDQEIARIAEEHGAEVPFLMEEKMASDNVQVFPDATKYILEEMEKRGYHPEILCVMLPTSPFRTAKSVDETIRRLAETGADWAITVSEPDTHPYKMGKIENGRFVPLIEVEDKIRHARRQDFPKAYQKSGAVTSVWSRIIKKEGCLYSRDKTAVVLPKEEAYDIHDPLDILIAEAIIKQRQGR